jgi:hypothetical protein
VWDLVVGKEGAKELVTAMLVLGERDAEPRRIRESAFHNTLTRTNVLVLDDHDGFTLLAREKRNRGSCSGLLDSNLGA